MEKLISLQQAAEMAGISMTTAYRRLPEWRGRGLRVFKAVENGQIKLKPSNFEKVLEGIANQS